jgi:hypothetical protein
LPYVKGKLPLCLINKAPCNEDVWGSGGIVPPFLSSIIVGGEWSDSRPGRFFYSDIMTLHTVWNEMGRRKVYWGVRNESAMVFIERAK